VAPSPAAGAHADVNVELRVVGGARDGMHVPLLPSRSLVFGRGAECDVVIPDMFLSRRHFRITRGSQQLEVLDLGSSNGTLVNGHPVSTVAVKDGDRIQLGRTVIVVCMTRG
jgi:pSer/pThr/pTyr-binding forkhead associated (FHA) protein